MKRILLGLGLLVCIVFAFLTYNMSSKTRAATQELARVEREMKLEREKIEVLRAEWAILTRPDRLRHLVELNFGRLELLQITEANYGEASSIPFSLDEDEPLIDNIDGEALDAILADIVDANGEPIVADKEGL